MSSRDEAGEEAGAHHSLELHDDGARVKRACERWPLLEFVRRIGSARRSSQAVMAAPRAMTHGGAAWWEV